MFIYKSLIFCIFSLTCITAKTQVIDISNFLDGEVIPIRSLNSKYCYADDSEEQTMAQEKVDIKLYYEVFCPGCRMFDTGELSPTVVQLASQLNLHVYPYGNAKTIDDGNGQYEFKCQHGPDECYGNKLHACAIDHIGNITKAVLFNSCMMESSRQNSGSDDMAADECGKIMDIETDWIKQCAKGQRGNELLKYYGDESHKAGFVYVPYVLINDVEYVGSDFFTKVCASFKTPPPACG